MVTVVIPVFNAGKYIEDLINGLFKQTIKIELIIIDSGSTDNTVEILKAFHIDFISIKSKDFNHGATRNIGLNYSKNEIVVFLTQDVILKNIDTIERLIKPLLDKESIALSYGRQLPHKDATIFGSFLRLYNYPPESETKNIGSMHVHGLKTYFISNSFAAYKKTILTNIGGFPNNIILGEDVFVGAKMIQHGYSIQYVADAEVYHSHNYSLLEEFKRYFDIGAFHNSERWLIDDFYSANGEGFKFVIKEMKYLLKNKKSYLLPFQIVRTMSKFLGYKLGLIQDRIPKLLKRRMSMNKQFWK
jgi:rhamnosyltransferase